MDCPEASRSGQRLSLLLKQLATSKYSFETPVKTVRGAADRQLRLASYRRGEDLQA